ncbi:hypothetical protein GEMRC1_006652 [Eukaryota sp. GEM-RC1]
MSLTELADNLKLARDHALLGEFEASTMLYSRVLNQLDMFLSSTPPPNHDQRARFEAAYHAIKSERDLVDVLKEELAKFSRPNFATPRQQISAPSFDIDYVPPTNSLLPRDPSAPFRPIPDRIRNRILKEPRREVHIMPHGNAYREISSERGLPTPLKRQLSNPVRRKHSSSQLNASRTSRPPISKSESKSSTNRKEFNTFKCDDSDLANRIEREIILYPIETKWSDIAGLQEVKQILYETVVLPRIRPDFFGGLRRPLKGILLHGPPGTGKTMIAKAVANDCDGAFFAVSTATLVNKYLGESEKMVKILFEMALYYAPSVIFLEDIDAVCGVREHTGHNEEVEAIKRLKSQLLVMMDGITTDHVESDSDDDRATVFEGRTEAKHVMVLGVTNRPWDLDQALIRRFEKRIHIPLPETNDRTELLRKVLDDQKLSEDVDIDRLAELTDGYSGADLVNICREASFSVIRYATAGLSREEIQMIDGEKLQPLCMANLYQSLERIRPSVDRNDASRHISWAKKFGSR